LETNSLTHKQAAFARAVASGMTHSDAYRKAYDVTSQSTETVASNAYKLARENTDIVRMIAELTQAAQAYALEAQAWNLDRQIAESATNVAGARRDKQWAAANGALTNIGKLTGTLDEAKLPDAQVAITKVTIVLNHGEGANRLTEFTKVIDCTATDSVDVLNPDG
jgi:murein L,D-transpeptidase YcbB/YkuD